MPSVSLLLQTCPAHGRPPTAAGTIFLWDAEFIPPLHRKYSRIVPGGATAGRISRFPRNLEARIIESEGGDTLFAMQKNTPRRRVGPEPPGAAPTTCSGDGTFCLAHLPEHHDSLPGSAACSQSVVELALLPNAKAAQAQIGPRLFKLKISEDFPQPFPNSSSVRSRGRCASPPVRDGSGFQISTADGGKGWAGAAIRGRAGIRPAADINNKTVVQTMKTKQQNVTRTINFNWRAQRARSGPLWGLGTALLLLFFLGSQAFADTLVQGTVSGVWSNALSPYRLIDNCTVNSGQTLTIEPGVIVKVDSGFSLNVYGSISAMGTPSAHIFFKSRLPSNYWNQIFIQHGGGSDSRFGYCNFTDATNAVHLYIWKENATMAPVFENCVFSNCVSACIYGHAQGEVIGSPSVPYIYQPTLNIRVTNSRFRASGEAVHIYTDGELQQGGISGAWANPVIQNKVLEECSG